LHQYSSIDENSKDNLRSTLKDIYQACGGTGDEFDTVYNDINEAFKANPKNDKENGDLVSTNFLKLLENPADAVNANDKIKANMQNKFPTDITKTPEFKGFDSIGLKDNVNECKNVTSLDGFANLPDGTVCTFVKEDANDQNAFIETLKNSIRYLIMYSLCSTYSDEATNSVEFNIIVKDLHNAIGNDNKTLTDIRDTLVHTTGTSGYGDAFDKAMIDCNIANDNKGITDFIEVFTKTL